MCICLCLSTKADKCDSFSNNKYLERIVLCVLMCESNNNHYFKKTIKKTTHISAFFPLTSTGWQCTSLQLYLPPFCYFSLFLVALVTGSWIISASLITLSCRSSLRRNKFSADVCRTQTSTIAAKQTRNMSPTLTLKCSHEGTYNFWSDHGSNSLLHFWFEQATNCTSGFVIPHFQAAQICPQLRAETFQRWR